MVESKSSEAAASKDVEPKATPDAKEEESKTPTGATSDSGDSASTKVDMSASSDGEALISDTESTGDTEEQKINEAVSAINLNSAAASQNSEYSEEELEKAEAFKTEGNELFKAKKFREAAEQYTEAIFCKISPQ